MPSDSSGALNLLLGAGGLAFLTALFKGVKELRQMGWKRRGSDISRLERYVREADEKVRRAEFERDWQQTLGNFWFTYNGQLQYQLNLHGIPIPEPDDKPLKPVYVPAGDDDGK